MTDRFNRFIPFILAHETEYQKGHYGDDNFVRTEHDSSDPGGATRYGIDKASHSHVAVESLTKNQAIEIYWGEWQKAECDPMAPNLGEVYFNAVVNCGSGRAAQLMRESNRDPSKYLIAQAAFYHRLVAARPRSQKYLKGWLNRVDDLRKYLSL
jgi:lysozyme family protein